MSILSPTGYETFDYGVPGWSDVAKANLQKLNDFQDKWWVLQTVVAGDDGKLVKYNHATGKWILASFTESSVQGAVDKAHDQNTDVHLGTVDQDIPMSTHKFTELSVPDANGQSIRSTTKITEVALEDAIDKKHSHTNLAELEKVTDGDHDVRTDNPHAVTKTQVGLSNVANLKIKLDATIAPVVGNDGTEGYGVGSRWEDITHDKEYVCLDISTGAAVWKETTGLLEDETAPKLGAEFNAQAHSIVFTEQVLTSGAAIAWNLVNGNKAILTAAHNFTITIAPPSGALKAQLIITQDPTGSRIMDEIVTQKDDAIAVADVHADTDIIDLTVDIPTGARIRFKTTAADLPVPLVVDTIYYAIRSSENHIKVATTKANAHAGTQIDITDVGTGTHTVQQLVKWEGGTLGILSTNVGREDILSVTYKTADKQWYAQLEKNYS